MTAKNELASTETVRYPILVYGKYQILDLYTDPGELVLSNFDLKLRNTVTWFRLIDSEFNLYKMVSFRALRSFGPFFGVYFVGPFPDRRFVVAAELEFIRRTEPSDLVEVFRAYFRRADGMSGAEKRNAVGAIEAFLKEKERSLAEVYEFFGSL